MKIEIENLSLRLSGVADAREGARLARLVADGLARADVAGDFAVGALTIHAAAEPGKRLESLSEKIVAAVIAEAARESKA